MDAVEAWYAAHAGMVTILAFALAIVGIIISVCFGIDARRQRSIVDQLLDHQRETISNLEGFLLGMKSAPTLNEKQVNDRIGYITRRGNEFKAIASKNDG